MCFTNQFLWFGTVKSYIFPKFSFFLFFYFPSPSPNPLKLNYIQAWLRDKKVQFCLTLLLVVIIVMLLSYVVRKLDFFISFPISKPFDFIPPLAGGGMLNFIHACLIGPIGPSNKIDRVSKFDNSLSFGAKQKSLGQIFSKLWIFQSFFMKNSKRIFFDFLRFCVGSIKKCIDVCLSMQIQENMFLSVAAHHWGCFWVF